MSPLPKIEPKSWYLEHHRMAGSSTVRVGPFDDFDLACAWAEASQTDWLIVGLIVPEDAAEFVDIEMDRAVVHAACEHDERFETCQEGSCPTLRGVRRMQLRQEVWH